MYSMWPGCYSFRDELKLFMLLVKDWANSIVLKIYELDSKLHT